MSKRIMILGALALLAAGPVAEAEAQRAPDRPSRVRAEAERARARAEAAARRGWIGITYSFSNADRGIAITHVTPGSPAERAGLAVGDTIIRWNGDANPAAVAPEHPLQPGDELRLRVRRNGRDRDVRVVAARSSARPIEVARTRSGDVVIVRPSRVATEMRVHLDSMAVHADSMHTRLRVMLRDSLGPALQRFERVEMPRIQADLEAAQARLAEAFSTGSRAVAGAEFAEINSGLSSYFGTERGALVLRVAPETPAARSGLQAGDVVVSANGHAIESVRDLREAVSRSRDRDVELVVVRRGARTGLRLSWE